MVGFLRVVLVLGLMLASTPALAGEQWVQARVTSFTCGYWSYSGAEVGLSYRNHDLPWGTSVYLIHGWAGTDGYTPFDWANRQEIEVAASAPYTWSATVSRQIQGRGGPIFKSINFVWRVVLPDGHEFYEKGNASTWGFYDANFSQVPSQCSKTNDYVGVPTPLTITDVVRW